ncbi:MAG: RecQ family ATP-dependent DNA helicase [Ignavibacteria bacterium]|nr:RecQ family ATP-dependent DNA helicase [Ignavibacteria bacterium]
MEPIEVLEKYFGYKSFRSGQEEIIKSILAGNDTLAIMPTGGGKSICYQIPALMLEDTAIVISPLIALMKNQVDALVGCGVAATYINSSLPFDELQERMRNILLGKYKIVYIAPERLENDFFKKLLAHIKISFLAVDEAHCISEWGHDFRPAYLNIYKSLENLDISPISAFTATAGAEVQEDIVRYLRMRNVKKFVKGFDRPNLSYHTIETTQKIEKITEILKSTPKGSTIIYCGSRNKVEEIAEQLGNLRFRCVAYHAGMPAEQRTISQNLFLSGEIPIIVATNAFGMGIDKPDVRNVIHCDYTGTLEAYYQEAGRAGRDGRPANCYLLHNSQDVALQEFFIANRYPEQEDIERVFITLISCADQSKRICLSTAELANQAAISEGRFASSLEILERAEIIELSRRGAAAQIQFLATMDEVRNFLQNTTEERREALTAILKQVSAEAFRRPVELDVAQIMMKFNIHQKTLEDTLKTLSILRFIGFENGSLAGEIRLLTTSKAVLASKVNYSELQERRKIAISKLNNVINYAYTINCKRNYILDYFRDDSYTSICGRCSSCTSKSNTKATLQKREIILKTLLNAVYQINNKFGKTVFIQLLQGKSNPKIRKYQLNEVELFGALSEFSEYDIKYVIDNAISRRLLQVSTGMYPILSITPEGLHYIGKAFNEPISNNEFIEKLKAIRQQIAKSEGITERSVASDKALRKIASKPHISYKEFCQVPGISRYIIEKYGRDFYRAINQDFEQSEEKQIIDEELIKIVKLFKERLGIEEIAKIYNTDKGTIARLVQDGIMNDQISFDWQLLTNSNTFNRIKQIIYKKPAITLSKLRDNLAEEIDYAVLRILVAIARKSID